MKSELFKIGPFIIHGYGLMIAIGIMAAYLAAEYRAKKQNLKHELVFNLTMWCLIGGILGAKVLYYITQIKEIISNPKVLLDISNGFVVYGGIIGGIFAGYLFCKKHKISFLKYFDLVMPSIALAQGFGRLGCLFAGCCYGIETKSRFGIVFPHSDYAPNGVALVPTQLISSGLNFLHFLALIFIAKRKKADGQIAGFYLIFYSAGRFILEFFRGDLVRGSVGGISTSQFISIFIFIFGWIIVLVRSRSVNDMKFEDNDESGDEFTEEVDEDETNVALDESLEDINVFSDLINSSNEEEDQENMFHEDITDNIDIDNKDIEIEEEETKDTEFINDEIKK